MPKFSVIIPTYNRGHLISRAIESIMGQTFRDYEIIVVDDGSQDETQEVLKRYQEIRYIHQENKGVAAARNRGIQEARGEYIAFTDDDGVIDSHWLASIDRCFQENRCDVVGGRVLPIFPDNTPAWVRKNPIKLSGGVVIYDYGEETALFDPSHYRFISANIACRKQVFDDCGGFSMDLKFGTVTIGEDTEFVERVMGQNKILYYCGGALVHHPVYMNRLTLKHAARWNTILGRFAARQEMKEKSKHFVYLFGAPRYLWKGVVIDFLRLPISVFDRLALYDACRSFYRKVGMILEYRHVRKII